MDTAELTREAAPVAFAFTEEHTALREMLTEFFVAPGETGWRKLLSEVGADEIVFDAGQPGASATAVDLAILAEQAGAALFGGPLLPSVAAGVLAASVDAPTLLDPLRDGTRTVGAAWGAHLSVDAAGAVSVAAAPVWNAGADDVVVVGTVDGAPVVALLTDVADGLTEFSGLDLTRPVGRLEVRNVKPAILLRGDEAAAVRAALTRRVDLVTAAELLGVAQHALTGTVEYVDKRIQFGRSIGSFQAVKHRLVDLLAAVELARSAVYGAAWHLGSDPQAVSTEIDLAVAAVLARKAALAVTKATVQLHGGIAVTWEHWAHLYLRRANSVLALTGSPGEHRGRLADLIDRRDA